MRKITLLIAFMLFAVMGGYAQAKYYGFAASSGVYTPITGTVVATSTNGTPSLDSYASTEQTLPAAFEFAGVSYTTYFVTSNGQLTLGGAAPISYGYRALSNSFGSNVVFSPFGADLYQIASGTTDIRTELVGSEIVIQWTNFRRYLATESFNFQVRLNTVDKSVKFVYGGTPPFGSGTDYQPQVGIKSAVGDYKALTSGSGGTWAAPTVITTGVADSSTLAFSASNAFTNGLTYTFTLPPVCSTTPVAATVTGDAVRYVCNGVVPAALVATDTNAVGGLSYQWQESANGTDWVNAVGGTGATTRSFTPPAFAGTSIQYRLSTSCPSGGDAVYSSTVTFNTLLAPTTQASAITLTSTLSSVRAAWTNGNGGRRVVIASTFPLDDLIGESGVPAYAASAAYAGTGQQIVYDGTGTNVTITGFPCNTLVYVKVYEYTRCGSDPYDMLLNTTTGTNAGSISTASPATAALPVINNFTGFNGDNLSTAVPGWYEAAITTVSGDEPLNQNPSGTTSNWLNRTIFGQTVTAKINLYYNTANAWIISPKMQITEASRLRFKAAITAYNSAAAHAVRMQGTDDKVNVLVSTDGCGAVWTPVYTFDASNTAQLTNALQDFSVDLSNYVGQTIQIAFQGTDGPVDNDPDYDFHIGNIAVEVLPTCDIPANVSATTTGYTTATVNWAAPATAPAGGYEYYYSTTNTAPALTATASGSVAAGVTTANLTGLTANSRYYIWVRSVCDATNKSIWETAASIFTGPCIPAPVSVDNNGMTNVTIGTINNTTVETTAHYANYTAQSTNVTAGTVVPFSVTYDTGYTYGTKIWVDWNNDTDFDDDGELVYTGLSTNARPTTLSGSFTVPASLAIIGSHTLRIGGTDTDEGGSACYTGTYGTYQDYTINVVAPLLPVITAFTPASYCAVEGVITITGTSLSAATLTIGGTAVTTTTNTDTQIVATVPAGVSGVVSVTTLGGTATTNNSFAVNTPAPLTLSGTASTVCAGTSTAAVTVTSDVNAYDTYVWSPATGVTGTAATGFIFTPAATTTYTLTASQSNGSCVISTTYTVTATPAPNAPVFPTTVEACADAVQQLTYTGGVPATINIGTGTTTNTATGYPSPYSNYFGGTKHQMLIRASELIALGYQPGSSITSISFTVAAVGTTFTGSLQNFQIDMGHTTATVLTSTAFIGNLTNVLPAATATIPRTNLPAASTHTLATPFVWNGIDNLVIQTSYSNTNTGNSTDGVQLRNSNPGFVSTNYYYSDGSTAASVLSQSTPSASTNNRPNIGLTAVQPVTTVWSPATNLYTDAAATTPYVAGANSATVYIKSATAGAATYNVVVTNTATGCSTTATANVTINVTAAPTAAAQAFCGGATASQLVATGTALQWYAAATGGTAIAGTTALATGTYYVSQTLNGCESPRTPVTVTVTVTDAPTVVAAAITVCNAGTVASLQATGTNIQWYAAATGGTALAATTAFTAGTTTYYATQTVNGCESATRTPVAVTLTITAAPTADATQTFCNTATVAGLTATGEGIQWFAAATGGEALAATTPLVSGTAYYAAQTIAGCTSDARTAVTATINVTDAPTAAAAQAFCSASTVSNLIAQGTAVRWYAAATGGTALAADAALVSGSTYYATSTANDCESATRTAVVVTITVLNVGEFTDVDACTSYTLPALTSGAYYTQQGGTGTTVAAGTVITETTTFYVYAQSGTCTDEASFTVNVNTTAAPTGVSPQAVAVSGGPATIEDIVIVAEGTVTWYPTEADAIAGTNAIAQGTELTVDTYYATQTINGCASAPLEVVVSEVLGNKGFDAAAFSYYPNPVNNILNVQYSAEITSVAVFNLVGQQVLSVQPNATNAKVDMTPLAEGTYLVTVKAGAATKTIKVVKKLQ